MMLSHTTQIKNPSNAFYFIFIASHWGDIFRCVYMQNGRYSVQCTCTHTSAEIATKPWNTTTSSGARAGEHMPNERKRKRTANTFIHSIFSSSFLKKNTHHQSCYVHAIYVHREALHGFFFFFFLLLLSRFGFCAHRIYSFYIYVWPALRFRSSEEKT